MGLDPEFFKELLSMFRMECDEHIQNMRYGIKTLGEIEPSDEQVEISETIHRAAHSLKGAARTWRTRRPERSDSRMWNRFASLWKVVSVF